MELSKQQLGALAKDVATKINRRRDKLKAEYVKNSKITLTEKEKKASLKSALEYKIKKAGEEKYPYTYNLESLVQAKIILASIESDDLNSIVDNLGKELGFKPEELK